MELRNLRGGPAHPEMGPEKILQMKLVFLFSQPPTVGTQKKSENNETVIFLKGWKATYLIFLVKSRMFV